MNLNDLALKYKADKSSKRHNYMKIYEQYFSKLQLNKNKILEIGVAKGASLKVWQEYFYNSEIYGIDINKTCLKYKTNRIHTFVGSQNDSEFLHKIGQTYGPFNIIIDDGSHKSKDIIISLENLLNYVVPGGLYIIEDLLTSYVPEFLRDSKISAIQYLSNMVNNVNFHRKTLYDQWLTKNLCINYKQIIDSIHFYSEMCFIIKKTKYNYLKG